MNGKARAAYTALTHRRGSRCKPDAPEWVQSQISDVLEREEPLTLVGFWGVGEREKPNGVETAAFDLLGSIWGGLPVGRRFILILADEHGRLNGKNPSRMANYLSGVAAMATERGFESIYQSVLWRRWGLREPFGALNESEWAQNPLAAILEARSQKHYQGADSAREDAQRYFLMCRRERSLMPRAFPGAIWWTYSSPQFKEILPDMPRVYFWSLSKGVCNPPWFM